MDGSCLKKNNQNFCTKFIQRHYLWHNIVIKWCELMGKDFNIFCLTKGLLEFDKHVIVVQVIGFNVCGFCCLRCLLEECCCYC